ncbi:Uncharacterised protein [BD1-7 clade bacterium]|uniref:DNA binding HTH domain-containing protein n=1 Tax=BD1-7 clade bacterium TaxID=2029982 RepID=A0A5S9PZP4_9GAMM|nr:Uncharacterised protein [BD1-7 clade bacterium]CAA0112977.1 Uncharacterised protein [BD1-7 clade bacterium]
MIQHIGFYATLPALVASCCLYLLYRLHLNSSKMEFRLLFLCLAAMNLFQSAGYLLFAIPSPTIASIAADAYLMSLYFMFACLALFVIGLTRPFKWRHLSVFIPPILLSIVHTQGLIVESYEIRHNSLMHTDGPLAWLMDVYLLTSCFFTGGLLIKGARDESLDSAVTSKCITALVSFIPLIAVFALLVALSMTKHAIPVVIIGPIITLYTALAFYYLTGSRVAEVTNNAPQFYQKLKVAYPALVPENGDIEPDTFSPTAEKKIIEKALEELNGDIDAVARVMGCPAHTLRHKLTQYEIYPDSKT